MSEELFQFRLPSSASAAPVRRVADGVSYCCHSYADNDLLPHDPLLDDPLPGRNERFCPGVRALWDEGPGRFERSTHCLCVPGFPGGYPEFRCSLSRLVGPRLASDGTVGKKDSQLFASIKTNVVILTTGFGFVGGRVGACVVRVVRIVVVVGVVVVVNKPSSARRFRWKSFWDSTARKDHADQKQSKNKTIMKTYQRKDSTRVAAANRDSRTAAELPSPGRHSSSAAVFPEYPAWLACKHWSFRHTFSLRCLRRRIARTPPAENGSHRPVGTFQLPRGRTVAD